MVSAFSQELLYRWLESFQLPRDDTFDFDSENEPRVVGLQSLGAAEDLISSFMSALHESYPCQSQKEEVVGFCAGADMQGLEKTSLKVSLLDDTNDEGCSSPYRGGLTPFGLYKALRRPTEGIPLYALEFHLPLYALRRHRKTLQDPRTRRTGEPLRQSQDVTFLRTLLEKNDNSGNDIIYQAKVSCLVSGWDHYSWVAYMFIDLYFEESNVDGDLESIAYYEQQLSDHGVRLDPFTAGETTSYAALREPREYFLQVLAVRLSKIKHEWEHLVLHIEEAIDIYTRDYWARLEQTESSSSSENPGGPAEGNTTRTTLRLEFYEWMKMTTALLQELISTIQEYDSELDLFFSKGVYYFHSFTHSTNVSGPAIRSLTTIDGVRDELGRLSIKLKESEDKIANIGREVIMSPHLRPAQKAWLTRPGHSSPST
ncbi:hypothetical protein DL770_000990 [Monosporascus sp. CRB-9-2]|nr:hypothetical protein DL770_000990 [Monosporascus sp. CRB-9-2]